MFELWYFLHCCCEEFHDDIWNVPFHVFADVFTCGKKETICLNVCRYEFTREELELTQTSACVFYWDSQNENTIFKMRDGGREQNDNHDKQNLQNSLMGPSGWQKKKQFKEKTLRNCQEFTSVRTAFNILD